MHRCGLEALRRRRRVWRLRRRRLNDDGCDDSLSVGELLWCGVGLLGILCADGCGCGCGCVGSLSVGELLVA